jgi:pentatricopeptide repeat protein
VRRLRLLGGWNLDTIMLGNLDTIMLDGYVKDGRVDRARQLFDGMPLKNMVSWTCTVSGYCRAGRVEEARQLFDVMPH